MEIKLKLTGTKAMLQHNGRLSNPVDPYTKKLSQLAKKTKKTEDDLISIMQIESRAACWELDDGRLGVPTAAVWRAIFDSAKMDRLGQQIKRGLAFTDTYEPLLVHGKEWTCDEFLTNSARIDYRSVVIGGRRVMRSRPFIASGWETTHRLELMADIMEPESLLYIAQRAGKLYGLGDWRPIYGTFDVEIVK